MRSLPTAALALALALALPLAGCIGADAPAYTLAAVGPGGAFDVAITFRPDGEVDHVAAWWADSGTTFNTTPYTRSHALRGVVVKNDVALDDDVPVLTDGTRFLLLWNSATQRSVGRGGDEYEFHALERAGGRGVVSVRVVITG